MQPDRDRNAHIKVPYPPWHGDREAGRLRLPAAVPLNESYVTQHLRVATQNGGVDLVPAKSRPRGVPPFPLPAYVVSAWSPAGRLETAERNLAAGQRLRGHLHAMLIDHVPAASYAPDRSWVEGSVVLLGMHDGPATTLGGLLSQPAVVRIDEHGVHVLPTGLCPMDPVSLPGWRVRPYAGTCPMRRDGEPPELCRNPGGPWVSRSREVGAVWDTHRRLLTSLLGCGVCQDGVQPAGGVGRAIPLTAQFVANRYGGWQFG